MNPVVKVIVKREKFENGDESLILFFPESEANYGRIEYFAEGCHGEADLTYFWSLKPSRSGDTPRVQRLLRAYERHYRCTLKRVSRDTDKMRKDRWQRRRYA